MMKMISIVRERLSILKAVIVGSYCIVKFRLLRRNVVIRFPFLAFAPVKIAGKGSVFIDKKCCIIYNYFRGIEIVTLSSNAKVIIGKDCTFGGLTIRCRREIMIGENVMTGYGLIQDSFFINEDMASSLEWLNRSKEYAPIRIGSKSWLGGQTTILEGTILGDESVTGFGTLCLNEIVPDYHLALGSPVFRKMPIERIVQLVKRR